MFNSSPHNHNVDGKAKGDEAMKVLVALDESAYSQVVVESVGSRQWKSDDQFLVLSVVAIPTIEYWQDFGLTVDAKLKQKLTTRVRSLIETSVARLAKDIHPKTKIESKVAEGHAGDQILQCAREWQADLIIMGTHGRKGLKRICLGSVALEVLREAPCSVEIVKTASLTGNTPKTQTLVQAL
jgi:nucleotide-binding universal stress UspA family protein